MSPVSERWTRLCGARSSRVRDCGVVRQLGAKTRSDLVVEWRGGGNFIAALVGTIVVKWHPQAGAVELVCAHSTDSMGYGFHASSMAAPQVHNVCVRSRVLKGGGRGPAICETMLTLNGAYPVRGLPTGCDLAQDTGHPGDVGGCLANVFPTGRRRQRVNAMRNRDSKDGRSVSAIPDCMISLLG